MSEEKQQLLCECKQPKQKYNEKYDARFCTLCDRWIEAACNDESCEFCVNRPEHPSQATDE